MSFFKYVIREWIELIGIATLVTFIWQSLELLFIKIINPNIVDTIVAIPIVMLLHYEYKKHIRK